MINREQRSLACRVFWSACLAAVAGSPAEATASPIAPAERTLTGHLLLPDGTGPRGIEVIATITSADTTSREVWMRLDEQNRFRHSFQGKLRGVRVCAGVGRIVRRIDKKQLTGDEAGNVGLGGIDLRGALTRHVIMLTSPVQLDSKTVRVGMWYRKPQHNVSGSWQFPETAIGTKHEWLLPHQADSVYFLVERPADSRRGLQWRSGKHHIFGPFVAKNMPAELKIDE